MGYIMYKKVDPDFLLSIDINTVGQTLFIILYIAFSIQVILGFPLLFFEGKNKLLMIVDQVI